MYMEMAEKEARHRWLWFGERSAALFSSRIYTTWKMGWFELTRERPRGFPIDSKERWTLKIERPWV